MATIPFPVGRDKENPRDKSIAAWDSLPSQDDDASHGEPMTKAEREEIAEKMAEIREMVHQIAAAAVIEREKAQPTVVVQQQPVGTKWFMAVVASITIMGSAATFIGNSGMWIGRKENDAQHQEQRVNDEIAARKELQMKLEKLRDLYMIRFSEDPDKVDTETMKRKKAGGR